MKDYTKIKRELFDACLLYVDQRLNTIETSIRSLKDDLDAESKSSAGDKHETGIAMLHIEMEKASQQFASIIEMKEMLTKIDLDNESKINCLGSLIFTDKGTYYLAISIGKVIIDSVDYFAVSTNSPIGKQLLGKTIGDKIPFNSAIILEVL